MARVTKLEHISDEVRTDLREKYLNYNEENEYSTEHPDALHDENDHDDYRGKGAGTSMSQYILPSEDASRYSYTPTVDTTKGGGLYDIDGNPMFDGGRNGRNWAKSVNLYNENNAYGVDTVDTSKHPYYFRTTNFKNKLFV